MRCLYTQCGECEAWHDPSAGEAKGAIYFGRRVEQEEGDNSIPSPQREAVRDHGLSPNGEEVVMDTRQVVVGSSQQSGEAVGCQPIRPCEEEGKEG